jgi:hypothetical protein
VTVVGAVALRREGRGGSVFVVERFELAQCVPQVGLVPDQGAVQELAPAGLHPPLHDRVAPHRQLHLIRVIGTDASG